MSQVDALAFRLIFFSLIYCTRLPIFCRCRRLISSHTQRQGTCRVADCSHQALEDLLRRLMCTHSRVGNCAPPESCLLRHKTVQTRQSKRAKATLSKAEH
ncbi:hypothetical protein GGI35DRAFT_177553 [Trichoderma velutinum]